MSDRLSLKRLYPDAEIYAALYDHPQFGKIVVGSISMRAGNPTESDNWNWSISISTLAPVYSRDDTSIPVDQRRWIRREAISFSGTARTKDEAIAAWKEHWPRFWHARTEEEWQEVKEDQDRPRERNKGAHR